jgi:thiosulfate/3-mercaptopyruvate sulfurtransferase
MEPRTRTKRGAKLFGRTTGLLALLALAGAALIAACGGDDEVAQVTGLDDRGYHNTSRLVTTEWIEDNLDNDSVLLIDRRGNDDYVAGHIPGAVQIPRTAFQVEVDGVAGQIPPAADVAAALEAIGATPDTTIVFYDGRGSVSASRGLWVLAVYGHADARLLDGDFPLWESEGREISKEAPTVSASDYSFDSAPDEKLIAGWDEIIASIEDPSVLVCDARSPEEYSGKNPRNNDRGGHIPDSVNVEWNRAIDENGRFLPADQLRELYEGEGVEADGTIYTLCQTAVRATHTWFVLQDLLGYEDVKVYDGSWIEYGNREDSPIDS